MIRLRGQGQQQGAQSDQDFLASFYNEITVSNFKDRIKTETDALRYCQLSGILPTRATPSLLSKSPEYCYENCK
jgi:hypothetical protein